jgi:predicted metal-dependent peptidase
MNNDMNKKAEKSKQLMEKLLSKEVDNAEHKLHDILTKLAVHDAYNFYGHILLKFHVTIDNNIETAGVGYYNNRVNLVINPRFLFNLSEKDQLLVLRHETLHVLFMHFSRVETRNKILWNIAGDIAINQMIFDYSDSESIVQQIGVDHKTYKLPEKLTAEQYYELLLKEAEQQGQGDADKGASAMGEALGSMQDLLESTELTDIDRQIIEADIKQAVKSSKDKCIGNVPNEILALIDILFAPPKVDWRNALRDLTGNRKMWTNYTHKRRSRRFGDRPEIAGKIKKDGFTLAVVCDVSGSMSNEEIVAALNEVKGICEFTNSSMWLTQVDTEATEPEEFTTNQTIFERKRRGGTLLYPGVEMLDDRNIEYDALLVLTDLGEDQIESEFYDLSVPLFWLTSHGKDFEIYGNVCIKGFKL